jgi:hypothetical protein
MRRFHPSMALLILAPWGCGPDSVTIPEVPNLDMAVALFEHPTGTVPIDAVSDQVAEAGRRLDALESSRLADLLADGLASLRQDLEANRLAAAPLAPTDPDKPRVDGYLRVHRVCKGWDDASNTPDPANGALHLLAVVKDRELQRALSITASACKGRVQVNQTQRFVHPYADGNLVLALEGPLPRVAQETRAVVQMDATIGVESSTTRLELAFRILYPRLEVSVPVSDGDIVVARDPNGFQMRGINGTFICSIETGTCQ